METSDHDLLIRVDERQTELLKTLIEFRTQLDCVVLNNDDFKTMKTRVNTMWDNQNKFVGLIIGSSAFVGGIAGTVVQMIKSAIAR